MKYAAQTQVSSGKMPAFEIERILRRYNAEYCAMSEKRIKEALGMMVEVERKE